MKNFVFVCGCGRSGTTRLTNIIGQNSSIAIGVERFHNLVLPDFSLTPEHFDKNRFFDFKAKDSHINLDEKPFLKANYNELEKRYEACSVYGDKIPLLTLKFDELFQNFAGQNLKIIFVVRNVIDVLNSYKKRFIDKKDPWKRDINLGIKDWNNSLVNFSKLSHSNNTTLVVEYENFYFDESLNQLTRIFDFLDVTQDESSLNRYTLALKEAKQIELKKQTYLSSQEKRLIFKSARIGLYKKLIKVDE